MRNVNNILELGRMDGQVRTNLVGKRKLSLSKGERHQEKAEFNSLMRSERPKVSRILRTLEGTGVKTDT